MKEIKVIVSRLRKFYQSLAQIINSGGIVSLNRFNADAALTLIHQLKNKVQSYSESCALMLEDIQVNLFVQNSDGTIRINPFRFGKLDSVLTYLESADFVCNFAKYINTPWNDINQSLKKLLEDAANASDRLSYNQVGVLAREIYILLGLKIYKPEMNNREDGTEISQSDAKGMIGSFIDYKLKGANKKLKDYSESAIKLAEHVTHTKSEDKVSMDTLVSAVITLVALISIIY